MEYFAKFCKSFLKFKFYKILSYEPKHYMNILDKPIAIGIKFFEEQEDFVRCGEKSQSIKPDF